MAKSKPKAAAVYIDPSTLVPWDKNPRNNEAAIGKVATSIERFGFASPIVARTEDGRIIAGHTRHAASLRLGLKEVPVRFLDVDEQTASALALADNRLGEIAEWDESGLQAILDSLQADGFDLDEIGWPEEDEELIESAAGNQDPPEVHFSEIIGETNQYVVLKFESEIDWLQAQSILDIETVTSKRQNGKPWSSGIGRVLDGAPVLAKLTGAE